MRLDQYLFSEGMAQSRERAQALIMAGQVYVNGEKAEKAGMALKAGAQVELRGDDMPYVSRGGLKLEKAMKTFDIALDGLVCMDVGASTGGFTDCMLQNGARRVYAVDVGYGQLAWKLRCDKRVVVMERTNIRHLTADKLETPVDFFTIDVSFISLKIVIPAVSLLATSESFGICLVKPQFEAGRDKVGKNGVVRDIDTHLEVLEKSVEYANNNGFNVNNMDYSPIKGPKGNVEFLMHVERSDCPGGPQMTELKVLCEAAHAALNQ